MWTLGCVITRLVGRVGLAPLNLLAPDVVCEAHFHVLGNGDSKMYVSKLPSDISPQELVYIVKVMLDNVVAFGVQHGVQVNVKQEGKP